MLEVISESLAWINLPFTGLLGLVLLYWITVILGLADMDAGIDSDADVGGDADVDAHGGPFHAVTRFFYIGEVPVLCILSVLALSMWAFAVLANHYVNPSHSPLLAVALFFPNLIVSGLVTRVAAAPLRQAFGCLNKDYDEHRAIVGRACVVTTSEVTSRFGQATIIEGAGAPIIVNARTAHGGEALRRGDRAIIFEEDKEKGLYFVRKLEPAPLET